MFTHIMVGANDLDASKAFYDAALGALGIAAGTADGKGRVFYPSPQGNFAITLPVDGESASAANGGTIGFKAASPEAVDAWHDAGLAHGGSTCEDPPGIRQARSRLYAAYLRDPAGNKIVAAYKFPD